MRDRADRVEELLRALVHEARVEKITFMAGSIAYHAFLSILPLLLLLLTVLERAPSAAIRDSVVGLVASVLTEQASVLIQQGIRDADTSVSVLGAVFLVWGALRIFRGLDTAFSEIYETSAKNTVLDQLVDGLVILLTVATSLVFVSAVASVVSLGGGGVWGSVLGAAATSVGLFVVFYPMYYVFPDTDVSVLEVVPGAAFAAVGLTVSQLLFRTFRAGSASGSNVVASILLLLTWLYIVGLVVLFGAVLNAVLSNRSADVDIEPVIDGVEPHGAGVQQRVSQRAVLAELDELTGTLEAGEELTVTVGDRTVTVAGPETWTVDRESGVFGMDGTVALTLRWWPEDG